MDKTIHIEVRQWDGNDSNNCDRDNRDRNSGGQGNSYRGRRWDNNSRGQGHSDHGRGRRWNPNQQYHDPVYQQESQFSNPNHYWPPPMGHQYRYPIIRIGEPAAVRVNGTLIIIKGVDKTIHIEVDEDSGMVMTLITVTETIGIEIRVVKEILIGVEDGIIIAEIKDTVIMAEGEDGIPISNITIQCIIRNPNFLIQIITGHHQ